MMDLSGSSGWRVSYAGLIFDEEALYCGLIAVAFGNVCYVLGFWVTLGDVPICLYTL